MPVFLIRHPAPQIATGICYGQLDVPVREVAATAKILRAQFPPDFFRQVPIISSPLTRCRSLAEILASGQTSLRIEPALQEMHFGAWEGRAWNDIEAREPGALDAWAADVLHFMPPGGESVAMLQARVIACFDALAAEGLNTCAVVTHAGVMRVALGYVQDLPVSDWSQLRFDYGECVAVIWPSFNAPDPS